MDDRLLFQEVAVQRATHYPEVTGALAGQSGGRLRADSQGRLVLSMAVPVQRYRRVLGALLISKGGDEITAAIYDRRLDILYVFAVALAATVLWSVYLAGTLARPIRRLAHAARSTPIPLAGSLAGLLFRQRCRTPTDTTNAQ